MTYSYDEFEFFNNQKNVIDKEVFNKFKKEKKGFYSNEKLKKKKVFLEFRHDKIETIDVKGIDVDILNTIVYRYSDLFFTFDIKTYIESKSINTDKIIKYKNILSGLIDWDNYHPVIIKSPEEFEDLIMNKLIIYCTENREFTHINNNTDEEFYNYFNIDVPEELENLDYVYKILKVIEYRKNNVNYRVAFCNDDVTVALSEESPYYNFMDLGRIIISNYNFKKYFFIDMLSKEYDEDGEEIYNSKLYDKLKNKCEYMNLNNKLITPDIYNFYKETYNLTDDSISHKNLIEEKMYVKYLQILGQNKKIIINGVTVTNNMIKLNDENFTIEFDDKFLNVQEKFKEIYRLVKNDEVRYNFNELYEKIIKLSKLNVIKEYGNHQNFKEVSFIVNNIAMTVRKAGNRFHINDVFVRTHDVLYLLTNILCYENKEEYKKYLKNVSHIGLKFIKLINTGINIELNYDDNVFGTNFPILRLNLFWNAESRRKIALLMNGKKYNIVKKRKFISAFDDYKKVTTIDKLKAIFYDVIEGFDGENFQEMLIDIIKEGKIVKDRGLALVRDTLKDIKGELTYIDVRGNEIHGYLFKGRVSKGDYFILASDLTVYKKMAGEWNRRCVVDRSDKNRIYEDRLANRLINIFNEPEYISTIH